MRDQRSVPMLRLGAAGAALVAVAGLLAGGAATSGCARHPAPARAPEPGLVVATVGGAPVSGEALAREMRASQADARRALDDLVTFELLARAAEDARVRLDGDGEAAIRARRVQALIERELEPQLAPEALPDAEVRALYERGRKRFVHGRQVQIAVLSVFTGARMKPEPRARAEATARELATAVAARPDRSAADFDAVARDPAWSNRKVGVTTVWQDENEPFPPVVGAAALRLARPGDTTPLVSDETGYYIARYIAERPPENVTFAEAAPDLRAQMLEPWRRQRFLQLTLELAAGHEVEVYPDNLALLTGGDEAPVLDP